MGGAAVVGAQPREHVAVAVGVEDAFEDDVVPGVEGVAGDGVDEADVRRARPVPFPQDDPAEVVLADQRQPSSEAVAQTGRDRGLPGGRVAAQEYEPGPCGAHPHTCHLTGGVGAVGCANP